MSRASTTLRRPHRALPASFRPHARALPWWKRSMDVVISASALVVLSPVFFVIALAVRLDSAGPAFFVQERMGRNGVPFRCWKFRSMCVDAEERLRLLMAANEAAGAIFKMRDDPRRTRVGRVLRKASLDELPQLWNVLRGEMTLVGPRPPLPLEVEKYQPGDWDRLRGVPGITGLWQVRARHRLNFEEMVRLDIQYLENISFTRDVSILLATIPAVLLARGSH